MATEELIEKQKLIREGLARVIHYGKDWACDWEDASDYEKGDACAKADAYLAFLTEKGAVLKFDPRARREGQMDEVPRLTMTAPLME